MMNEMDAFTDYGGKKLFLITPGQIEIFADKEGVQRYFALK